MKRAVTSAEVWADRTVAVIEKTSGGCLAAMALVTVASVVLRMTLNRGLPDGYDLTCLLQGMAVLWGMAPATYGGHHITVDLLWEIASEPMRRAMDTLANSISLLFLMLLSCMTLARAWETFASGLTTAEFRLPVWPLHALAAFGLVGTVALAALRTWRMARDGTSPNL